MIPSHTMSTPTSTKTTALIVEARVPDTHSACQWEHQWHRGDDAQLGLPKAIDVTRATAAEVFEHRDVLLAACPDRSDYEFRVVLTSVETTTWVVS